MARRNGTGTIKPCLDCGRPTRPNNWPAAKHPGTIAHAGNGLCSGCATKKIRATQPTDTTSVPERPGTDYNRRALLDYFASRRKFRIALGQTEFPDPLNVKAGPRKGTPHHAGRRTRPRAKCGTPAAYQRHIRENEPIDDVCRKAHTERARTYRAQKKAS